MQIEYPSHKEKERSIAMIKARTRRKRVTTVQFLIGAYREVGLSIILRRSYQVYALSVLLFVLLLIYALDIMSGRFRQTQNLTDILSLFFAVSPFVLLLTDGLYQLQERPFDVYELQNVHKYAARHLILLRMPLFSLGTILVDFVMAFVWCFHFGMEYLLSITAVIASSVLLYSVVNITLFNRFRRMGLILTAVLWTVSNAVILLWSESAKSILFSSVPAAIHIAAAVLMLTAFCRMVRTAYQMPACRVL